MAPIQIWEITFRLHNAKPYTKKIMENKEKIILLQFKLEKDLAFASKHHQNFGFSLWHGPIV